MPIIQSAKKASRQSQKRRRENLVKKNRLKKAVKETQKKPEAKKLSLIYSLADRASKTRVIHPNKAKRIKRKLAHLLTTTLKK